MTITLMIMEHKTDADVLNLIGSGLMVDEKLKVRNDKKEYFPYVHISGFGRGSKDPNGFISYFTQLYFSAHPFKDGEILTIEYNNIDLITGVFLFNKPDTSGIYYIDANIGTPQDVYYGFFRAIPNPTIRTALIGE